MKSYLIDLIDDLNAAKARLLTIDPEGVQMVQRGIKELKQEIHEILRKNEKNRGHRFNSVLRVFGKLC
jgi:hypothetical protein